MALIEPTDLQVFKPDLSTEQATEMIKDALAEAYRIAPFLSSSTDEATLASAKAILRRALLRWADAGSGALQQWTNTDGPFGRSATVDTRQQASVTVFYPSEEDALRSLGPVSTKPKATMRWAL